MLTVNYAECHIKAPYAECRYAECRSAFYDATASFAAYIFFLPKVTTMEKGIII
jgi:hypothetical protein